MFTWQFPLSEYCWNLPSLFMWTRLRSETPEGTKPTRFDCPPPLMPTNHHSSSIAPVRSLTLLWLVSQVPRLQWLFISATVNTLEKRPCCQPWCTTIASREQYCLPLNGSADGREIDGGKVKQEEGRDVIKGGSSIFWEYFSIPEIHSWYQENRHDFTPRKISILSSRIWRCQNLLNDEIWCFQSLQSFIFKNTK